MKSFNRDKKSIKKNAKVGILFNKTTIGVGDTIKVIGRIPYGPNVLFHIGTVFQIKPFEQDGVVMISIDTNQYHFGKDHFYKVMLDFSSSWEFVKRDNL